MSRVRGKDTRPELIVRRIVHGMGYRYRLHVRSLPGSPDLVLPRHHKVIFVHGCFWHQHEGCKRATIPSSNRTFWRKKLTSNRKRDAKQQQDLQNDGWAVLVVWECQTKDPEELIALLRGFLDDQ